MWATWIGEFYPAFTPDNMIELSLTQYVSMRDALRERG